MGAPSVRRQRRGGWLKEREVSYGSCLVIFACVVCFAVLTPFKEYYLGSYVTKPFDEVRDDIVSRKLHHMGVVTSGVHYFDTFDRAAIPLVDAKTGDRLTRTMSAPFALTDLLVRANVKRSDLLTGIPEELLSMPMNLMEDVYGPLCGATSAEWDMPPQLLFGNWFPTIRHEFCRDFHSTFPLNRFFNHADRAPVDTNLSRAGEVTLGLIAVVNMSEVYLRHFNNAQVVRKIMSSVQRGYLGLSLPEYTDAVAQAIVDKYKTGIPLRTVISLLPGSMDRDHIALVDVLGVSALLKFYLEPQQLTMGVNVNGEAAILAEVTHATASYFTTDFLINSVGMHLVSTMHLAPFWYCAIQHTTMSKTITVSDVDAVAIQQCGHNRASVLPTFAVNLMFLFQKEDRDYASLDNTTTYTLGRRRESETDYASLLVREKLDDSPLLSIDGSAWTKVRNTTMSSPATTPYGYLFTPDCREVVRRTMQQGGRNVQKYQAYLGDGLGNCAFRDSQETPPQTLCRLFMTSAEVQFWNLDGQLVDIPTCASYVTASASAETQALQQNNLRQIEWFMIDTTPLPRRIRIQDNTSRQIRTFLLILNFIGATYYAIEYIFILVSVWAFVRNSVYQGAAAKMLQRMGSRLGSGQAKADRYAVPENATHDRKLKLFELLQCDPATGALNHPGTMVLMYLGAIGSLSNIFSLGCSAQLSTAEGRVVIFCTPSIPPSSFWLVVTTLSSSYWVIRVTIQMRSFAARLEHAVRSDVTRFWIINAVGVLVLHFACKIAGDLFFQNTELHSDPHIYAIFGGLAVAFFISLGFMLVHTTLGERKSLRMLPRRGSGVTSWKEASARAASDRAFLAKWSASSSIDSVLYHCATPVIAQQLEALAMRQVEGVGADAPLTNIGDLKRSKSGTLSSTVRMHEFVAAHCAAGVHSHLKSVVWRLEPNGCATVVTMAPPTANGRVFCATEQPGSGDVR